MSTPLTSDQLLRGYALGVFPMARNRHDQRIFWIDPEDRGILPLDGFHLPRSLRKILKKGLFTLRCDTAFAEVIRHCAAPRPERPDTWINDEILRICLELHEVGIAHSVEAWLGDQLVGGLYGLSMGSAFFGESMFSRVDDASKVALAHLVAILRKGGYKLLDTQFVTHHLAQFGAVEIPRRQYLGLLTAALEKRAVFQGDLPAGEALALLSSSQSTTQMS
ncbi:MAG TPA: leucyl/phenylalanyl-tRNA--protein transferase [Rhodospirillaceae bacterium]|nr:leucyl/phenylalanyl-tRNA--protein transferase [Rhodospirillaceae bacterium]